MIPTVDNASYEFFNGKPSIVLPMTNTSGKVRLKNRNSFYEYGMPFAPR